MTSLETPPFSASSSWNTQVSNDASFTKLNWPGSTGYNYSVAWDSYSPSVYVASASDPLVQVTYPPGWGYPGGTVSVHMPAAANGAAGTDGELIVIDGDVAYNFWQFSRTSATSGKAASFASENVVTGDGWGSKSPFLAAGITAAGASQLGGLLVKAETDDGVIHHALQLAVDFGLAKPGAVGQAINSDGSSSSGIVQEGQHLAIPPGTPMPAGLSPLGQQVFRAMQQYGAYVIDVAGGTTNIRAQANAYDAATMTALWHDMGNITPLLHAVSGGTPGNTGGTPGTIPPVVTDPPPVVTPPTGPTSPTKDTTAPTLQWVAANGPGVTNGSGTVKSGDTVSLTLKLSEVVNVSGTPTMSLNSNGTAKYVSGSGTDTLQFEYKVAAGENAADLAISGFNLSGVKDLAGNVANLTGAPLQPAGTLVVNTKPAVDTKPPVDPTKPVDTTAPKVQWIAANGTGISNGNGTVRAGDTVRLAVNFDEVMTVNGTPTLSLNSNGTAKYVSGAGTNTLQFDYKVGAGEKAADLAVSGYNLGGVTDKAGNAVSLTGAPLQPAGTLVVDAKAAVDTKPPVDPTKPVDTTAPKVQWISATGSGINKGNGTVRAGDTVRLSVNFNEVMTVNGTPTLSLNSNGTAKYVSGAGTNTLQFDYKVGTGEKASDLAVSKYNLGGVTDKAGNAVSLSGAPLQPAGTLAVRTTSFTPRAAALTSSATDLAAPATVASAASPTTSDASRGTNSQASNLMELTFGSRKTLGFPGSTDQGASSAANDSSSTPNLALLSQYSASSFATPAATSTAAQTQGWWGNSAQTLAKPQG